MPKPARQQGRYQDATDVSTTRGSGWLAVTTLTSQRRSSMRARYNPIDGVVNVMEPVKFCPLCGGKYSDETYFFCLSDGTQLNEISDHSAEEVETVLRPRMEVAIVADDDEVETVLRPRTVPTAVEAEIRRRSSLTERSKNEETGLQVDEPTRMKRESDTYWNTRVLTFRLTGTHFRTPQFNLELLKDFINSKTFGQKHVIEGKFVAPGQNNLNFLTKSGKIVFDAHSLIDPNDFCRRFGLD